MMQRRSFLGGLLAGVGILWIPRWPWSTDWPRLVREEEERARMAQPATGHFVDDGVVLLTGPTGKSVEVRGKFSTDGHRIPLFIAHVGGFPNDVDGTWNVLAVGPSEKLKLHRRKV